MKLDGEAIVTYPAFVYGALLRLLPIQGPVTMPAMACATGLRQIR